MGLKLSIDILLSTSNAKIPLLYLLGSRIHTIQKFHPTVSQLCLFIFQHPLP